MIIVKELTRYSLNTLMYVHADEFQKVTIKNTFVNGLYSRGMTPMWHGNGVYD